MKVINNSIYNLSHETKEPHKKLYSLEIGSFLDVPKEVADLWLKIDGVKPYVTPEDIETEKKKAVEAALKAEREKTAEKEPAKTTKKTAKKK